VVIGEGQEARAAEALAGLTGWKLALGGAARSDSVKAGLFALAAPGDALVLIHDAARPLVRREHVERLLAAVEADGAAILALPLADTLKRDDGAGVSPPRRRGPGSGGRRRRRASGSARSGPPTPPGLPARSPPTRRW